MVKKIFASQNFVTLNNFLNLENCKDSLRPDDFLDMENFIGQTDFLNSENSRDWGKKNFIIFKSSWLHDKILKNIYLLISKYDILIKNQGFDTDPFQKNPLSLRFLKMYLEILNLKKFWKPLHKFLAHWNIFKKSLKMFDLARLHSKKAWTKFLSFTEKHRMMHLHLDISSGLIFKSKKSESLKCF